MLIRYGLQLIIWILSLLVSRYSRICNSIPRILESIYFVSFMSRIYLSYLPLVPRYTWENSLYILKINLPDILMVISDSFWFLLITSIMFLILTKPIESPIKKSTITIPLSFNEITIAPSTCRPKSCTTRHPGFSRRHLLLIDRFKYNLNFYIYLFMSFSSCWTSFSRNAPNSFEFKEFFVFSSTLIDS